MIEKKDLKISNQPAQEEDDDVASWMKPIKYSEDQIKRLKDGIRAELKVLKQERQDDGLKSKWDSLDAQYAGDVEEDEDRQFNLHRNTTKIKVDAVVGAIMAAFFEVDPLFSLTPRPEFARKGGEAVCEKQEDFLDYRIDNVIPLREEFEQAAHSAVLKGCGWIKWQPKVIREKRKRPETYVGKIETITDPSTQEQKIINKGLDEFLQNYPDALEKYPGKVKALEAGRTIRLLVEYTELIYNDPVPKFIDLKDLYVRKGTKGYQGMKTTRLISERDNYTWWELKKLEKQGYFENLDDLVTEDKKDDKDDPKKRENYETESFDVFEHTYYFLENEDDEEETKIKCWISEEKDIYLGSISYPHYGIDCEYVPRHIKKKGPGIYKGGIGEDLTDNNIAEDALMNFTLENAWIKNMVTPITPKNSDVDTQFLNRRWVPGLPIHAKQGEIDFLQKYMGSVDSGGMIGLMQYLVQDDDDVSGVSSGMSGRESPVDPRAPASKTIALLERSGVNVKRYVMAMSPAFNEDANIILQIYYQISKEDGVQFRRRQVAVAGAEVFDSLTRSEMIARTNIQSRAHSFNFDKRNEKQEDIALLATIRQEPLIASNPMAVWTILKAIIKGWSPKWKNIVDKVLPPIEEFKKEMQTVAIRAVAMYMKMKVEESQLTQQPLQFDPNEIMKVMMDALGEMATPPSDDVVKEREKNAK